MKNTIKINDAFIDAFEITQLLNQGRKIEAIKLVCDKTKIGLKEAKELVDKIASGTY